MIQCLSVNTGSVITPVNSFVTLLNPAIHLARTNAQFPFFLVL